MEILTAASLGVVAVTVGTAAKTNALASNLAFR
jgi:hypothetical protein